MDTTIPLRPYGRFPRAVNAIAFCILTAWLMAALSLNPVVAAEPTPAQGARKHFVILALGTSLTQGYNLPPGTDFTAVLEAKLKARGHDVRIVNAGVSGDTSAGGLARLDWALGEKVDAAIVELGSNDALRGASPEETRANLDRILTTLKARNIRVLLTGMMAPRNLGPDYARAFDAIYPDLARVHQVRFYPFFLDGVAANLKLNQKDGIHPNEAGTQEIVSRILPHVEALITNASPPASPSPSKPGA